MLAIIAERCDSQRRQIPSDSRNSGDRSGEFVAEVDVARETPTYLALPGTACRPVRRLRSLD
jgi:hypothetical protein